MVRGIKLVGTLAMVKTANHTFVGSLACQRDSFKAKEFETTVIACDVGKKKNTFEIELQDTILFPEGGGQPSDSGKFLLKTGASIPVSSVFRRGLHAVHITDRDVPVGAKVSVEIDWDKRLDYMQQHTGQHLVSAILEQKWGLKTLSWSMGGIPSEKKPKIEPYDLFNYLEINRRLTSEEVKELSDTVTEYITVNPKTITIFEGDPESQGEISTHKVPDDYDLSKGVLRVVHIEDLDKNPCCGTHLQTTSQISSVLILPSQSSVRGTNSRLFFMCGDRVRRYALFSNEVISNTKKLLSCSEDQIEHKCDMLLKNMQKTTKREQFWIKELAGFCSKSLITDLKENSKAHFIRDEYGTLEFLTQLYNENNQLIAGSSLEDYCYVLAGREKASGGGAIIIVSDSSNRIQEVSDKLKSVVSQLKGGGGKNGGKWQGKVALYKASEFEGLQHYLDSEF
ncbi:putative alanine--tRNA ligase [Kluyveromyces lactis]|uniref:KLLA0D02794p n=1 Tax=Kluyveromyces lactis (strain ATCC 8585 / CBS 2359 / DSM 70799 / NBRC 1267 / NRRL Y-1140 / WM37) TaxID=284590 RepID=Q6CS97_KLULA|nr:uncharacterized protein KLLA0_D02794g [Kluyveromyces lactis]CAH00288.1 KLLA0D02794p [Kluyveromyces lactis]|eukprot:XP_453192.1 uncharacterized protein KLLA0_D02794g [Kluyveromyces lactis]